MKLIKVAKIGAPLISYQSSVCKKFNSFGIKVDEVKELMSDRSKWRKMIHMDGCCHLMKTWFKVRRVSPITIRRFCLDL